MCENILQYYAVVHLVEQVQKCMCENMCGIRCMKLETKKVKEKNYLIL